MSRAFQNNWKLHLGIILFLAGQVFSIAHASEFGSDSHEHNGVVCVAILNDEPEALVSAKPATTPTFKNGASNARPALQPAYFQHLRAIRPPATGPPSI